MRKVNFAAESVENAPLVLTVMGTHVKHVRSAFDDDCCSAQSHIMEANSFLLTLPGVLCEADHVVVLPVQTDLVRFIRL